MAAIKIVVIGANPANAEELKNCVVAAIGGDSEIITVTLDRYKEMTGADLYVCLINRKQEVEEAFGADKVVAMTLVPPTEYFLWISRIPAGSSVVIFNNSTSGTTVLTELLQRYGLTHLQYEVVPYDEWDEERVARKIAAAKYIAGGIAYVGEGKTLQQKYGQYLSPDAVVLVSPPRIATAESISRLSHVYSSIYHRTVMEELKRLSSLDYLTEIPNRRTFDEVMYREWGRAQRDGTPLALAMIDIDFFKKYNDRYGHSAGDECPRVIARALKSVMRRPADFCARYGGEEFAVILPNTSIDGARHVMETFRQAIHFLMLHPEHAKIIPEVTVSVGIAEKSPVKDNAAEDLLKRADKALYRAKSQGRNNICLFDCSPLAGKK